MQIKEGARVETTGGEKVGSVGRVVIDPRTKEITHIVVSKGLLFKEDKVLPLVLVESSDSDRVVLNTMAEDLDEYPDFEHEEYVIQDERSFMEIDRPDVQKVGEIPPSVYPYPSVGPGHYWVPGNIASRPFAYPRHGYVTQVHQNIPDDTVALKQGSGIITEDGEKVGELHEVLVDSRENRATHLVISRGLLSTEKKLIPVDWITNANEEEIHIGVHSKIMEGLKNYESD